MPFVLAAKLLVPALRPETTARARISEALDAAVQRPLTVLCAPAGYGKTTALAQWLAGDEGRVAWISLDADDNDPRRMWAHLLAAIDEVGPEMDEAELALRRGSELADTIVPLAANALARHSDEAPLLVLDDYHLVHERRCHQLLDRLIDAATPALRVVIATRTAPPLRLARRRAAGTLSEIGVAQLRFETAEVEQLLNGPLALALDRRQIAAVDERIEGWPAGLALVGASLSERERRGRADFVAALAKSHMRVVEYLLEEVLHATEPPLRRFLSHTSVLSRLSAPLCEAVLQDPAAPELLAEVRRSNVFVTVADHDGEWVRYHPLFADVLARELRQSSPQLVAELHQRAARWFEHKGLVEDAVGHLADAGDGRGAARLLHEHWIPLLNQRRYVTVRRLIDRLPADRGDLDGFCEALDLLCASLDRGDMAHTYERLQALEARRDEPGVAPIVDRMRISPFYGHISAAVRAGWKAWERYLEPPELRLRIAAQLGAVLWFAGDRTRARALLEPRLTQLEALTTSRAWALATLALSALDDDEAALAERYGREAVGIVEDCGGESAIEFGLVYVALGAALVASGQLDEAEQRLRHAARVTGAQPGSIAYALTLIVQARLDLVTRVHHHARARAAQARRIIDRYPDVGTLAIRLADIEAVLGRRTVGSLLGSDPTPAESRVLALLPEDLTVPEIAAALHLSANTVRSHVRRLFRRLGVESRADAVRVARQRGLL